MKKLKIWQLVSLLVVVVFGGILFVGLAAGWFSGDAIVIIDKDYICEDECSDFKDVLVSDYEGLINDKKTFILFVDQDGCTTADRLRTYALDWASQEKIQLLRMAFSDVKESSLFNFVKYYPSVVIVSEGKVVGWLKADSDDDAVAYNDYNDFAKWMEAFKIRTR
ncbi:hypothetical protein IKX73_00220 [Candidatus Saccharibacteria bacterium]|nr:hypothetical protein [Candidatus Saccharibacteria bacterium]